MVSAKKASYVGREALLSIKARGVSRRLVGLTVAAGGVPRPGFLIQDQGRQVGTLTSGTFSPSLKRNIGLGYVPIELSEPEQRVQVEMRGKPVEAEVVKLPFVPHHSRPRATM